ncbi:MAG TPA: hypothetical protein VIV40_24015 [Kofleriaceae bacterium]|jgi:hypothetical protein
MQPRWRLAWLLVIAGCYTASTTPTTISNRAETGSAGLLTITEDGFGPLRADTPATLTALRAAFTGYDVRPTNDSTLSYSVYLGDEKLAWVIPNENGTLFNVHATSPRIETRGHDWRVGSGFQGSASLTDCECWGDNPTCYRRGGHVAVNFKRGCAGLVGADARGLRVLDGVVVQRVIWSPTPFSGGGGSDEIDQP